MKNFCRQWLENWRQDCRHFRRWQRPCRNDRGAALLEFALTLPLLLIITVFLVEMALFWEGRILGNHASFALARIAKVHYQPGLKKEEQVYFPEKCLLNSGYLETREALQSQLSTERLVTAFFLFPVTRQQIGSSEDKIPNLSEITSKIPTQINDLMDVIFQAQDEFLDDIKVQLIDEFSGYLSGTLFCEEQFKAIVPKFGGFMLQAIRSILIEITSDFITDTLQQIFTEMLQSAINPLLAQYQSFTNQQKEFLKSKISEVFADSDQRFNFPQFLFADFLINCYRRYDLACQRVKSWPNNSIYLDLKVHWLAVDDAQGNQNSPGFFKKIGSWLSSQNPFKSSDFAEKHNKVREDFYAKNKNTTAGCLSFPRYASDAEALPAIIAVELKYPVKSHWFSLTASMMEDNSFTNAGQLAFICKHAVLAELPKQNIDNYFSEYKTWGNIGNSMFKTVIGRSIKILDEIEKMINKGSHEIAKKTETIQTLVNAWQSSVVTRQTQQNTIITALGNIGTFIAANYPQAISSFDSSQVGIEAAKTALNNAIVFFDTQKNSVDKFEKDEEGNVTEEETENYKKWNSLLGVAQDYSNEISEMQTNYFQDRSTELINWNAILTYYDETLPDNIYNPETIFNDSEDNDGTNNDDAVVNDDEQTTQSIADPFTAEKENQLTKARERCRRVIFSAISNMSDFDLFTDNNDPFDPNGPQGSGNDADTAFNRLNSYYSNE